MKFEFVPIFLLILQLQTDCGHITFIFDPSPAVMLGACIVEGCAISSFAFRRQAHDRYQAPIFVFAITAATISGLALGINANVIMLGVIPWAVFLSMVLSTILHWFLRRYFRAKSTERHCCESLEVVVLLALQALEEANDEIVLLGGHNAKCRETSGRGLDHNGPSLSSYQASKNNNFLGILYT
ncbi:hypothetical protein G7Y89_g5360 [Cudoniella acicularis]|uniref:Uncharacterized protein n=1 Tax=Cudoniella acicularis TaxID=354080 RepID=A0A8H4RP01_9HELO|nr:hypothetical protein G7Y89_g5360 [Cudoniella acicularis]